MLLKSSDFISHDLSAESVFEGCADIDDDDEEEEEEEGRDGGGGSGPKKAYYDYDYYYKLELVLRKWFAIDPSREMRAFVRDGVLIGTYVSSFLFLFSRCDVCYWVLVWRRRLCRVSRHVSLTVRFGRSVIIFRHIAARWELLRVSERARDAAQDRLVVRRALDGTRQAKVDRPSIL